jgi:hypothetical protein
MNQTPHSKLFNVVVVPTSAHAEGNQTLLLSAMRHDRGLRLVSEPMPEADLRRTLALAGASLLETEQLLRGNRMAYGARRTDYLHFTEEQLLRAGLAPEPPRPEKPVTEA